jgi:predicted 3-demethylubiquinone-9 3-methyltransferase (glyoxalase superfamily)
MHSRLRPGRLGNLIDEIRAVAESYAYAHRSKGADVQKITPFLWFDNQAEEAAELYTSAFDNSKVLNISRYGEAGPGAPGAVMTVEFELEGQKFVGLNGGPEFQFTEAISFQISCETQDAMLQMRKIEIAELERAAAGQQVSA